MKCNFLIISIIIEIFIGKVCCDVNYCTDTKCRSNHIACNNNGDFGRNCPADRSVVQMTPEVKAAILNKHNSGRMSVANGSLHGKDFTYPTANHMIEMIWDDELSYLALLTAKTCVFNHDKCRDTVTFENVGQNIAIGSSSEQFDVFSTIKGFIDMWFNEYIFCNINEINKLTGLSNANGEYGHFTQIVTDKAAKIGCGMTRYSDTSFFVCNYSYGNLFGSPVYVTGRPCSACETGCSKTYPGLCTS